MTNGSVQTAITGRPMHSEGKTPVAWPKPSPEWRWTPFPPVGVLILLIPVLWALPSVALGSWWLEATRPPEAQEAGQLARVLVREPPTGLRSASVAVDVSAGRLVARRQLEDGSMAIDVQLPRLVEPGAVKVSVEIAGHGRRTIELLVEPTIAPSATFVSDGPVSLTVPQRFILGHDESARVSFRQRRISPVRLYANVGTLTAPKRRGSQHSAEYRPPETKYPTVAIIVAASDDGTVVDWAPIQLYGRPLVTTRSEARAEVRVRVGEDEFGPIRADTRGNGSLRVLVPPGVEQARTIARDRAGNESQTDWPLGVTARTEAYVICPPESERLYYFALDGTGKPRSDARLQVTTDAGNLSEPEPRDGYFVSTLDLPDDATMGDTITLSGSIEGEPNSARTCTSNVVGEAPSAMEIATEPRRWNAAMGAVVKVHLHMAFEGHRKPRVVPILAEADFGELSAFSAIDAHRYEAIWRLPRQVAARHEATLRVRTGTARSVSQTHVLHLERGPARHLELTCSPQRLVADGRARGRIHAVVLDAHGNTIASPVLAASAKGHVTAFAARKEGHVATYVAPRAMLPMVDEVEVRLSGAQVVGRCRIELAPVPAGLRWHAGVGYWATFGKLAGPAAAAGAIYRLPAPGGGLFAGVSAAAARGESFQLDATQSEAVRLRSLLFPLGLRVLYELRLPLAAPYVTLGPELGLVKLGVSSESAGDREAWSTIPGAAVGVGLLVPLGPGAATFDVLYRYMPVDSIGLTGNVGGAFIGVGFAQDL